ncbi:MAG: hypothetical protein R3195_05265 [Gemmatimonadota bacterium]|nr:hypothetical protein [Gemmatimonadota bacterium]
MRRLAAITLFLVLLLTACRADRDRAAMAQVPMADTPIPQSTSPETVTDRGETPFRRLWAGEGFNFFASSPSPDGQWVTEIDWTTGDLAVRHLESGELHRITDKGARKESGDYSEVAIFSPDGRRIAYSWYVDEKATYEVRIVDFAIDDRGIPRASEPRVVHAGDPVYAFWLYGWTPEDEILAGLYRPDNSTALGFLDLSTGEIRPLKSFDWADARASLSRDGETVAYDHPAGGGPDDRDIFLLASDASHETVLVEGEGRDEVLGWGPGDRSLFFLSERSGSPSIWRVPMSHGRAADDARLIREGVGRLEPLGPAGEEFYVGVEVESPRFRTARIDFEKGVLEPLPTVLDSPYRGPAVAFDWSPDGRLVAHAVSVGQARARLFFSSPDGNVIREWNLGLRLLRLILRWTPDGESILLSGQDDRGRAGLFRVDLDSETTQLLRRYELSSGRLFSISPDGGAVLYTRVADVADGSEPKRIDVVSWDLESGTEQTIRTIDTHDVHLGAGHSSHLVVSPDGEWVAYPSFSTEEEARIRFFPTAPGSAEARKPLTAPGLREIVGWTPDGRSLLYLTAATSPDSGEWATEDVELWSASGDHTRRLATIPDYAGGARLNPDGRTLAYRAGRSRGEIWALDMRDDSRPETPR